MLKSARIELELLQLARSTDGWAATITELFNRMNEHGIPDLAPDDIIDALRRLHQYNRITLLRYNDHFKQFANLKEPLAQTLHYGQFRIKITPDGRPHLETLQEAANREHQSEPRKEQKGSATIAPQELTPGGEHKHHTPQWDVFISHASEDKHDVARPLHDALADKGLNVWLDELQLTLGDSLRQKIDHGLARSRYGVVILSKSFFGKHWTEQELNGLATRETNGVKVILPVWHNVDHDYVATQSPTLADRKAAKTSAGIDAVAQEILNAINAGRADKPVHHEQRPTTTTYRYASGIAASPEEIELLVAAAKDGNIFIEDDQLGKYLLAGSRAFVDQRDAAVAANYREALQRLIRRNLTHYEGGNLYVLTGTGFKEARQLAARKENQGDTSD